jgi:hypothetical protein
MLAPLHFMRLAVQVRRTIARSPRLSPLCASLLVLGVTAAGCGSSTLSPGGGDRAGGAGTSATGAAGDAGTAGTSGSSGTGGGAGTSGGSGTGGVAGAEGKAGAGGRSCATGGQAGGEVLDHRPQSVACAPSDTGATDAGTVSCTQESDCQPDGGPFLHCVQHACSFDQCLGDDDCSGGGVCVCAKDAGFGLTIHLNRCAPATCRIDADCGAGGLCSPSYGPCQRPTGYQCRDAADTCCTSNDCAGMGTASNCEYSLTTSRWQCSQPVGCGG